MHSGGISSLQLLAQSTIQDRKRHLSSARLTRKPEVIPADLIRAINSGLPTTHPELMLASQNPDCETPGVVDKLMKI
jgi:hypothetical protein